MIGGKTRVAAVIGDPVEHTLSPALHNAAFAATGLDAVMVPFRVEAAALSDALRGLAALGALGASVTVPHKERALACCDEASPEARAIGAANCVVFAGRRLVAHNTDAGGFADALAAHAIRPGRTVVLGAGGAARAVVAGLTGGPLTVIARRPDTVDFAATAPWARVDLERSFATADLVVDCTPLALTAAGDATLDALPVEALPATATVVSLVYHRAGGLLAAARSRGLATLDGRDMLIHQAARAFTLWTSLEPPLAVMRDAVAQALR